MHLTFRTRFFAFLFCCSLLSLPSYSADKLTVDDFISPPTMLNGKISPNGRYLASVWNIEDQRGVIVFDLQSNKIVTKFADGIIRPYSVSWANDERILVKLLVPYRTEKVRRLSRTKDDFDINDYFMFGRVVSTNIHGEELVQLMNDDHSTKHSFNLANITHYLPADPKHVLMSANRRDRLSLYKVNIDTGESQLLTRGGKFTVFYLFEDRQEIIYRYDYRRIAKTLEVKRYTSEDRWELIDTLYFDDDDRSKNKIELKDLAGIKDGNIVYRKLNEDTGFHELISLINGERKVLVSEKNLDIVGVVTDGFDSEIIAYTTLDDVYRTHYFDRERQAEYDVFAKKFESENFTINSRSNDNSQILILASGASRPSTFYRYQASDQSLTLFNYPYAQLVPEKLAATLKIQYPTRDKALINAYVYLPPDFTGSKPIPLVVLPHGGPQARDFLYYDDFAQFIATRGYMVIKPNFRGSTGYGKAFEEAGYKEWGGLMQEDLEDAVKFLVNEQLVSSDKVCIVGISYGGYAALQGLVKTPDMYQCAISINGVTHLADQLAYDFDKFDNERTHQYLKDSVGDPETEMAQLNTNSPSLNVSKITKPILLIQSEEDKVVPFEQAEVMIDALKEQNKEFKFITLEDSGHNPFHYKEDIVLTFSETEAFLKRYLSQ